MDQAYLWLKALHLIAVVAWFAGLLYLPRLFIYHRQAQQEEDQRGAERFCLMERRLYRFIMNPAIAAVFILGILLLMYNPLLMQQGWLHAKFVLVGALLVYHLFCGRFMRQIAQDQFKRTPKFLRWFNEFPSLLLVVILILAIVKPF